MTDPLLALDFGGTKLAAAVTVAGCRSWQGHARALSPPGATAETNLTMMVELARRLLGGGRPAAVGVSFGGPVAFQSGTVRLSHHVPGWENVPLRRFLEETFHAPTAVDNDATVAALGEHRYGAGQGTAHLLYITVSTGVGGGWILDGRPWRGADGMAGEIGHTLIEPGGPLCTCGKAGCVERLASGPSMARDAREQLQREPGSGPILWEMVEAEPERVTGEVLSKAAAMGDPLATTILHRGARALGVAIGNAANLVNPQRVVLGGGVTKAGSEWWNTVRETVAQVTLPEVRVEVVPASLGDDAPLWGALALAYPLHHHGH